MGPRSSVYPRDAPAPLMLCRDAGSFGPVTDCHRPSFWIDRKFRFQQAALREELSNASRTILGQARDDRAPPTL